MQIFLLVLFSDWLAVRLVERMGGMAFVDASSLRQWKQVEVPLVEESIRREGWELEEVVFG
jgi:hypothetical protein